MDCEHLRIKIVSNRKVHEITVTDFQLEYYLTTSIYVRQVWPSYSSPPVNITCYNRSRDIFTNIESFYVTVHIQKRKIATVHKIPVSIFFVKSWKNKGWKCLNFWIFADGKISIPWRPLLYLIFWNDFPNLQIQVGEIFKPHKNI